MRDGSVILRSRSVWPGQDAVDDLIGRVAGTMVKGERVVGADASQLG